MIRKHKTDGSKPETQNWNGYNVTDGRVYSYDKLCQEYYNQQKDISVLREKLDNANRLIDKMCDDRKGIKLQKLQEALRDSEDKVDELAETNSQLRTADRKAFTHIQSLTAQLKDAREKNVTQNLLLGKKEKQIKQLTTDLREAVSAHHKSIDMSKSPWKIVKELDYTKKEKGIPPRTKVRGILPTKL